MISSFVLNEEIASPPTKCLLINPTAPVENVEDLTEMADCEATKNLFVKFRTTTPLRVKFEFKTDTRAEESSDPASNPLTELWLIVT